MRLLNLLGSRGQSGKPAAHNPALNAKNPPLLTCSCIFSPCSFILSGRIWSRKISQPNLRPIISSSAFARMKITQIESIHLRLPHVTSACDGTQDTLAVRVHTDEG